MRNFAIIALIVGCCSCSKEFTAPVPDTSWADYDQPAAVFLTEPQLRQVQGVYRLAAGNGDFGDGAAMKYSYQVTGTDTSYYVSGFCERDVSYFICQGKRLNNEILLNGYWRKMVSTETGKMQLRITEADGAAVVLAGVPATSLRMSGLYGRGAQTPGSPVIFERLRDLFNAAPFEVLGHRGGGRTSDLLPASENSLELIRQAASLGCTGIEIDVRMTSDGVPVLYHDATLNARTVQQDGLLGPIKNYTFAQLDNLVRLKQGEKIPTLEQALHTILEETPLRTIWLDTKFDGALDKVRALQKEFLARAAARGRALNILIGLPDEASLENFLRLPDFKEAPSLCELSLDDVERTGALVWAPRWTLGLQNEAVQQVQAANKRAFVWTLDEPVNISKFMQEGNFNGILTNYPTAVAFLYYAQP